MGKKSYIAGFLMIVILFLFSQHVFSQIMHYGLKGGFQMSWVRSEDSNFRKNVVKILPVPGYNAGAVFSFKVKDRFFLHTEYLYTTKGKKIKGRQDPILKDNITYNYLEIPILYNVYFKAQLKMKNVKQFKWYAGIGPSFSYWLGGKGSVYNDQLREDGLPTINYKIRLGKRPENDTNSDIVYYNDVKRLQLGLNVGGGILLEPVGGQKIMIDARFELGHTWLGKSDSADYVYPLNYDDNIKARNMGLRLSVMYLLEMSLDKKTLKKGKSTIKKKQR